MESRQVKRTTQTHMDLGKIPPQAIELEEAVLGAILLEREAFAKVAELLKPESFYKDNHVRIYNACCLLKAQGEPIDMLTVVQQLKKTEELEIVGGAYYISQLTNKVASTASIEYHARIIAQKFIQRKIIHLSTDAIREAYEEGTDCFELLNSSIKNLKELEPSHTQTQTIFDAYEELYDNAMKAKEAGGRLGLQCHIVGLNNLLNGINPMLIVIGARPSIGKSALMKSVILSLVKQKIKCKVFSMEVRTAIFINNIIAEEFRIDSRDIANGNISMDQWMKIEKFRDEYLIPYLDVDDNAAVTIQYIEPRIKKAIENGCKIVAIDYLQLMTVNKSDVPPSQREQQIAFLSKNIVRIKKEYNVPILQLCQLSRAVEERKDKKPMLSDLRESGSLEQDAEVVIMIHRPEFYGIYETSKGNSLVGKAKLLVVKHRNGPLGTISCRYEKEFTRFCDEDEIEPFNRKIEKINPEDEPF